MADTLNRWRLLADMTQDDANVVLERGGLPTWSRFTGYAGHQLPSHGALRPGEIRMSPDKRYVLKMRRDGDLVTYDRSRKTTTWSTSRRSASTTPARSSSPPTGPTA